VASTALDFARRPKAMPTAAALALLSGASAAAGAGDSGSLDILGSPSRREHRLATGRWQQKAEL
jgi:hypothetical protein